MQNSELPAGKGRGAPFVTSWSLGAIALIILLAVAGYADYESRRRLAEDDRRVSHSHLVIAELDRALSYLRDAESGQRGYMISGEADYLAPFENAKRNLSAQFDKLKQLTSGNPDIQNRIPELRRLCAERLDVLDTMVRLQREGNRAEADRLFDSRRGYHLMGEIRRVFRELTVHEERLLAERTEKAESAYYAGVIGGIITTAVAIAGVLSVVFVSRKSWRRQVDLARETADQRERLHTTLASIGDAVIATDSAGRITLMNAIAEELTGWTLAEAEGHALEEVFRIVNEITRETVESPVVRALREGVIVGLANHTSLIGRDGRETPIDDSAAPIRNAHGEVVGSVLVFRDVTVRRESERTLTESERRLRLALDAGQMGTWEWDLKTNEVSWSPGLESIHGLTPGTFPGNFEAFETDMHPDDRAHVFESISRARQTGEEHHVEYRIVLPDGRIRWVEGRGKLFTDEESGHHRMIGVCTDITARKRNEEVLQRNARTFFDLVANSPFGIYMIDSEFRLIQVGKGAQKVFAGIDPLIGRDFAEVLRIIWQEPFASEAIERFRHTLETGEPYHAPNTTERRGNLDAVESYDWKIERITLPDGQFGVVCHFYDATALREAEEALRQADRSKDEFLATLAHELRNPLAPIRSTLELLRKGSLDAESIERAYEVLTRQAEHLNRQVDDLLDIVRISRGVLIMRKESCDIRQMLYDAIEMARSLMDDARQVLSIDIPDRPIYVNCDPHRIAEVVGNLLVNAHKFTPDGGRVSLSAKVEGAEAMIQVTDNGSGIAPENLAKVFELFGQGVEVPEGRTVGLGVGLALAARIVQQHEGTLSAESEGIGKGSQFTVRLPICEPPRAVVQIDSPSEDTVGRRILIVDDNRDAADSLAMLLQLNGHETRVAYLGADALELAPSFHPEVAFLDLGMPQMDGYEIARQLRGLCGTSIMLVALTGWGQDQDVQRTREAGFDAHLTKPASLEQIQELLSGDTSVQRTLA